MFSFVRGKRIDIFPGRGVGEWIFLFGNTRHRTPECLAEQGHLEPPKPLLRKSALPTASLGLHVHWQRSCEESNQKPETACHARKPYLATVPAQQIKSICRETFTGLWLICQARHCRSEPSAVSLLNKHQLNWLSSASLAVKLSW